VIEICEWTISTNKLIINHNWFEMIINELNNYNIITPLIIDICFNTLNSILEHEKINKQNIHNYILIH
jgi:hypothetical protein